MPVNIPQLSQHNHHKGTSAMQNCLHQNFSLDQVKKGEHAIFISISAEKAVTSRLTSLGFTPGVEIEMKQNFGHGPLVVNIRGTRVALGRSEAKHIAVDKGNA
jgi:ferrous iron transport protein A